MDKKTAILFKVIVSLGLITLLISQVDFKEIINILKNVDITMIIYALTLLTVQVFIATVRWQLVLKCQKIELDYKNTLQILYSGLFFNQAMPSSVGGDVIRGYYLKKQGMTLGHATLGVLMDRLFGMVGLVLLVLASLPLLFELVNNSIARTGVLLIASSISLALLLVFFTDKLPGNFSHFKIIKGLYSLSREGRHCISDRHSGLIILLISVLIHLISVFSVMIMSIGLGLDIEWGGFLLMVPLVGLMMVVPISIAGWGVREGVMVVGFGYLGVASEAALALSILYGLSILVVALPGGVIWMFKRSHTSKSKK
jgi:glycosyltransferase 2 family protein